MPTSAMTALATLTLSAGQATVTFSSIVGTYRDLRLIINVAMASGVSQVLMQINGDTGANYNKVMASGTGSSTQSGSSSGATYVTLNYATTYTTTFENVTIVDFLDSSATDKQKSGLYRRNTASSESELGAWRWASTSAITSISLSGATQSFAAGSTFTLYGVSA